MMSFFNTHSDNLRADVSLFCLARTGKSMYRREDHWKVRPCFSAVSRISCLSYWNNLWNTGQVAVEHLFLRWCFQELFKTARSILAYFPPSFFSMSFVSIHVVPPYSRLDIATAWKKSSLILSNWSYLIYLIYIYIYIHIYIIKIY